MFTSAFLLFLAGSCPDAAVLQAAADSATADLPGRLDVESVPQGDGLHVSITATTQAGQTSQRSVVIAGADCGAAADVVAVLGRRALMSLPAPSPAVATSTATPLPPPLPPAAQPTSWASRAWGLEVGAALGAPWGGDVRAALLVAAPLPAPWRLEGVAESRTWLPVPLSSGGMWGASALVGVRGGVVVDAGALSLTPALSVQGGGSVVGGVLQRRDRWALAPLGNMGVSLRAQPANLPVWVRAFVDAQAPAVRVLHEGHVADAPVVVTGLAVGLIWPAGEF